MDLYTQPASPTAYLKANPDVAAWLETERNAANDFARSLWGYLQRTGKLTDNQAAAVRRGLARTVHLAGKTTEIDLTGIPSGMYAVPNGETRLKLRIRHATKGRWEGFVFVDDGAAYGSRKNYGRQAPGGKYTGDVVDALVEILKDPMAASAAYGQLVGRCGVCGLTLEDPESVARGIGPICLRKF